jgi:hypothetical protein
MENKKRCVGYPLCDSRNCDCDERFNVPLKKPGRVKNMNKFLIAIYGIIFPTLAAISLLFGEDLIAIYCMILSLWGKVWLIDTIENKK